MSGIRFSRKFACEVRIAFPERLGIAVGDAGISMLGAAVTRVSSMGERVTVGVANWIFQFRAAGEISTLVGRIAPRAVRIPVPGANREFGVLAIGDRPPSS